MRCLCCGKKIGSKASESEKMNLWHKRCIKSFFGTEKMPFLDISEEQLEVLANTTVNHGLTVPGVQKKLSLHLSQEKDTRLTIVDYPTGYILKPQTEEYDSLPEYENLTMRIAEIAGVRTVPHALIKIENQYAYITKRIDREFDGGIVYQYAMEDFCQLANRLTLDKYKGSYELCGRIIKKYSAHPGLDLSELFLRIVVSFIVGNSDMHLKNFSLREMAPANREYCLSKAYDILPVNIILPSDKEQLALTLNGKKRNIRKKDFKVFAENCGISDKTADNIMKKVCFLKEKIWTECDNSYLNEEKKEEMKNFIEYRINCLI